MLFLKLHVLLICVLLTSCACAQRVLYTEVLVVGGGTGGTAAGIQCGRMNVKTIIAEPTSWLGGMLSSAGVSATDGNHFLPSGIWAEFRDLLYRVYGGPGKVATGWVSHTLFEPHVADSLFKKMAAGIKDLQVLYHHRFIKIKRNGNKITGAVFLDAATNQTVTIYAKQTIDATELGDVMAEAGVPFDTGMEASHLTGENVHVPESNDIIQDLTYAAILKDYGAAADCTLVRPVNYDPMEFDGCCNEFCSRPEKLASNVSAQKMLEYGRLPNGKYMINWPGKGNDFYLNLIPLSYEQREEQIKKAKAKTVRFLYFLQTQFGFKNLDLADEFPTTDQLPLIPYHREGRRLKGIVRFKLQHIAAPYDQVDALYRTGISVGDYPIDHHHRENPGAPQHLGFYPVPSYTIPLGALIPEGHDGLIVAEKGISVSNVVNGTTRLQPVVLLTGQAAGSLAALCVQQKKEPRALSIRKVQQTLLAGKNYIMPYFDVPVSHPHFVSIQKIGATGILKGRGEPFQWANRTWFYPDSLVNTKAFIKDYQSFLVLNPVYSEQLLIKDALEICVATLTNYKIKTGLSTHAATRQQQIKFLWEKWGLKNFDSRRPITRGELAVLLDKTVQPFERWEIDFNGHYKPVKR